MATSADMNQDRVPAMCCDSEGGLVTINLTEFYYSSRARSRRRPRLAPEVRVRIFKNDARIRVPRHVIQTVASESYTYVLHTLVGRMCVVTHRRVTFQQITYKRVPSFPLDTHFDAAICEYSYVSGNRSVYGIA